MNVLVSIGAEMSKRYEWKENGNKLNRNSGKERERREKKNEKENGKRIASSPHHFLPKVTNKWRRILFLYFFLSLSSSFFFFLSFFFLSFSRKKLWFLTSS